jgi:threonine/homoserine/homoserine lactone efflux protein
MDVIFNILIVATVIYMHWLLIIIIKQNKELNKDEQNTKPRL